MDGLAAQGGVQFGARGSERFESLAGLPVLAGRSHQTTLRNPISCRGVGLHSGRTVNVRMLPAAADHGIVFRRADLGIDIPARFDRVVDARLSTVIADTDRAEPAQAAPDRQQVRVATIEHAMAAFAGCGIDNALVELDGPEMPALDGSAAQFVFLIDCAGRVELEPAPGVIEVIRRVRIEDGAAFAEFRPSPSHGLSLSLSIAFAARAIGDQSYSLTLAEPDFRRELADCRTFALLEEIEALQASGLALGGSLDNAIVVDGSRVINPAGLRHHNEFVRHKMLDAVGDLALAGRAIHGHFVGHRSGHAMNNRLLRALLADPSAWRLAGSPAMRAGSRLAA